MKSQRLFRILAASLLTASLSACQSHADKDLTKINDPQVQAQEASALKDDLYYIASDDLEGRGLKTEGLQKAAAFIAEKFKAAGLKPLPGEGMNGYFQPFDLTVDTTVDNATALTLAGKKLAREKDFQPMTLSADKAFDAPIVFAGYGINSTEHKYNDYDGIDVNGKIVLVMRYEPHDKDGGSRFVERGWSDESALSQKAKAAANAGAAGVIFVNPPTFHGIDLLQRPRSSQVDQGSIPAVMITNSAANAMLKDAGKDNLKTLQKSIDSTGKPNSFALGANSVAGGEVRFQRDRRTFKNVVALLPGKGKHKDEYIVVGAHYDHLGRGEPGSLARNSKEIHNGADDNGSGTVSVIELAKKIAAGGRRDRSIIFMTFVGEERGLLGSEYFVKHCPIPTDKIAYMLNLDMVGRVKNETLYLGGVGTAADLENLMKRMDDQSPLTLKVAGRDVGGKGGMGPSDHASFAGAKIPVIFLYSGMHPDYHRPTDDPDKINYASMAEVVDLSAMIVDELVKLPREQYVSTFDRGMMGMGSAGSGSSGGSGVRLGIMPNYEDHPDAGVVVESVLDGTPAMKAGLKAGDTILSLGQDKTDDLNEYMDALAKHKPGDKVDIVVKREGKRVVLQATLEERQG